MTTIINRGSLAWLILLMLGSSSPASVTLSINGTPTVGLDGFMTYTFKATAAADEKIIGFDFVGGGGAYGISGPMNQVNPLGQQSVFSDANALAAIGGASASHDSQFNVLSTKGIAINAAEGSDSLQAAFNYFPVSEGTDASSAWDFLQIVSNSSDLSSILYNGTLTIRGADGVARLAHVSNYASPPPQPPPVEPLVIIGVPPSVISEPVAPVPVIPDPLPVQLPPDPLPAVPPLVTETPPAGEIPGVTPREIPGEVSVAPPVVIVGDPTVWVPHPIEGIDYIVEVPIDPVLGIDPVFRPFPYWYPSIYWLYDAPVWPDATGLPSVLPPGGLIDIVAYDGGVQVPLMAQLYTMRNFTNDAVSNFGFTAADADGSDQSQVPEPASIVLTGLALLAARGYRRR